MNWQKIDKAKRKQESGEYNEWKEQIAADCYYMCVYCSIHESHWGGIDHYHIDHYKPKSKFPNLINTITNLYYACPVCNRFKSDDWQGDSNDLNVICYPDPSDHDYRDLLKMDLQSYILIGKYTSSKYLINKLYLNRPQLIYERRENCLRSKAQKLISETAELIKLCNDIDIVKEAFEIIASITQHIHAKSNIRPYKLVDIRRKK